MVQVWCAQLQKVGQSELEEMKACRSLMLKRRTSVLRTKREQEASHEQELDLLDPGAEL